MVKVFRGLLIGLSSKQVQVRGHVTLEIRYGDGEDSEAIEVNYLIVDVVFPYKIILGLSNINALEAVIST